METVRQKDTNDTNDNNDETPKRIPFKNLENVSLLPKILNLVTENYKLKFSFVQKGRLKESFFVPREWYAMDKKLVQSGTQSLFL